MAIEVELKQKTCLPLSAGPSPLDKLKSGLVILTGSKVALIGAFLVGIWIVLAIFADNCIITPMCWIGSPQYQPTVWLARYSPLEQMAGESLQGPSAAHWLGTDQYGRNLWARLVYGARIILTLAPFSILVASALGILLGLVSAYRGGLVDETVMRFLDALLAFPRIVLYLVILAALGPSKVNVVLAITLDGVSGIARLVRSLALDIKTRDFVAAAEARRGKCSIHYVH